MSQIKQRGKKLYEENHKHFARIGNGPVGNDS